MEPGTRSAADKRRGPQPYDFRRPTALSRDHLRTVQIVSETFIRQAASVLTALLNVGCEVAVASVDQLSFDEYMRSLETPTFIAVLDLAIPSVPQGGTSPGTLTMVNRLAMAAVEHLLGGAGTGEQPARAVSEIEASLLRTVVERVLGELQRAFAPVAALETSMVSVETNPSFTQVMAPSDAVLMLTFDVLIGATAGNLWLCLPLTLMAPALEAAVRRGRHAPALNSDAVGAVIGNQLMDVPVDVIVGFAPLPLRAREVLTLDRGDVLTLRHAVDRPLEVSAGGVTYADCVVGASGQRQAVRIVRARDEISLGTGREARL